jgi:hypothetical protein
MSFPNISDILATTIENRSKKIADSVTKNNALLAQLERKGRIKTFSGGHKILQELSFADNANAQYYSGYEPLNTSPQDVISAAEFEIKQAACAVTISGLEELQNNSKEQMIDLMEARVTVAESSMANLVSGGIYSDGTGSGGKQITGLNAAVPTNPATGTYGNINRANWTFWRSQVEDPGTTPTSSTLPTAMNSLWAKCIRGVDRPDLIVMDGVVWQLYIAGLQALQRFAGADSAGLGFPTVMFMDADCVLDGGIGGYCPASTAFFLNTKYIHYRPHADRNMTSLSPGRRFSVNQDATVQILAWAGNCTMSGSQFQGRLIAT